MGGKRHRKDQSVQGKADLAKGKRHVAAVSYLLTRHRWREIIFFRFAYNNVIHARRERINPCNPVVVVVALYHVGHGGFFSMRLRFCPTLETCARSCNTKRSSHWNASMR